uniref:BUB1 N-terminal domain-containing protein n=1 Tax=Leersia perrieri TaxID=77586 RepID=A0A0D9VD94_9ORYZ
MAAAEAGPAPAREEPAVVLDKETLMLLGGDASSPAAAAAPSSEWETFKENVRPLKRGRNVAFLNRALKAQADPAQRAALLAARRKMIEAINEYRGEDPLQPWLNCIKWVQESFPTGGDCSGLVVIYEQCVRAFWHDERYKDDLRYLKVWLEYAGNCADSEVIFRFLEANQIGQSHTNYYLSYASLMESKNKLKKANELFHLGISRKAKPVEKLETTYRAFLQRSSKRKAHLEDDTAADDQPVRNFGTVLNRGEIRGQHAENSQLVKPRVTLQRIDANRPLAVYKDENSLPSHGPARTRSNNTAWQTLGTQADRNKENNMRPAKWTSHKIPQKVGSRAAVQPTRASSIEVFVDDESAGEPAPQVPKSTKPTILKLRQATSRNLKQETELLMENPLRNFPLTSLR